MYILRLLVLLILSLFQPISSERRLIDGRYSRLSRSTCADKIVYLDDTYRSDKSVPENRRLNDLHEVPPKKHRYEVRDARVATALASGERHSERLVLALRSRSLDTIERQQDRTVTGTIRNFNGQDHLGTLRENVRNAYTYLHSRLFHDEPEERESRARLGRDAARAFERNISKRDLARNFEEVVGRIRISKDRQASVSIRNNEHFRRQKYTHGVRDEDIVQTRDAYVAKTQSRSLKGERHSKYNTMASTEEKNYQKFQVQSKDRQILSNLNKKFSESLNQANRITNRSTVDDDDRAVTRMTARLPRHNVREIYIPTEHSVRPSVARSHENKRSNSNRERYTNIRDARYITTSGMDAKDDRSERFMTFRYDLREQGAREVPNIKISESLRERTNKRAGVINEERYVRDSTRNSISIERKLREGESQSQRRAQYMLILQNYEKRNVGNNAKDIKRIAKNQSDVSRVMAKKSVRSREDRQPWTTDDGSDSRNAIRHKRNIRHHTLDRELKQHLGRILNENVSRNRLAKDINVYEPITIANEKRYSKDDTRQEPVFSKYDVQQGSERMTNIPSTNEREFISNKQQVRSEGKKNFKNNTGQTVVVIEREKSKSNARISREHLTCTVRSNVRNTAIMLENYGIASNEGKRSSNVREQRTRTARASLSPEREGSQTNVERIVQGLVDRIHGERRWRGRDEDAGVRRAARHPNDVPRERAVSAQRNVCQQPANRVYDRHIDNRHRDRTTSIRDERSQIRNNIRHLREDKSEGFVFRARGELEEYVVRNREEQNAQYASTERTRVRNTERYLAGTSLEKSVLHETDVRKRANLRISNERMDQRYSRTQVRGRSSYTEQKERQSHERRHVNKPSARDYERISIIAINERIDNGKTGEYLQDSMRARTISIERTHKSDLIRAVDVRSGHRREERASEAKSERTITTTDDRETRGLNRNALNERVAGGARGRDAHVRDRLVDAAGDQQYTRSGVHDRAVRERRAGRRPADSAPGARPAGRARDGRTAAFGDTRGHASEFEYYVTNHCHHVTVSAGRDTCLIQLKGAVNDYTHPRQELNVELRDTRVVERPLGGTSGRRPRGSPGPAAERRAEAMPTQLSAHEHDRGGQSERVHGDVLSARPPSPRSAELPGARDARARQDIGRRNEIINNKSDTLVHWQYLFYAVQGIYVLVVFVRASVRPENDKTRLKGAPRAVPLAAPLGAAR